MGSYWGYIGGYIGLYWDSIGVISENTWYPRHLNPKLPPLNRDYIIGILILRSLKGGGLLIMGLHCPNARSPESDEENEDAVEAVISLPYLDWHDQPNDHEHLLGALILLAMKELLPDMSSDLHVRPARHKAESCLCDQRLRSLFSKAGWVGLWVPKIGYEGSGTSFGPRIQELV